MRILILQMSQYKYKIQIKILKYIIIFCKDNIMKQILLVLIIGSFITGCNEPAHTTTTPGVCPIIDKSLDLMHKKEITDSIDEYNATLKNDNNPLDICMNAGKVKAAYEHAKDHNNTEIWDDIEKTNCRNAGL